VGLNPEEGFLLSRIDGCTTWAMLREIGGLTPEEVDMALESWVGTGLVVLDEPRPERTLPAPPKPDPPAVERASADPAPEPDPSLDLNVDLQREIFAFEGRMHQIGYFEILGVDRAANGREIKRAYFKLSKRYHPDRYFRRNIGDCAQRLDRIFKRVVEAYELLSDPTTRAEIERMPATPPAPEPDAAPALEGPAPAGGYRAPTRMENLARLRRSFAGANDSVLAERRFRAGQFFEAAQSSATQGSWLQAAASVRLAIAFDPYNTEYKRSFAAIQAEVQALRALELLNDAGTDTDPAEALEALEEVICYKPADANLQARAAEVAIRCDRFDAAAEYAERACELEPEEAQYLLLKARVQRRQGNVGAALATVEKAAKLAPGDTEVEAEKKRLVKLRASNA